MNVLKYLWDHREGIMLLLIALLIGLLLRNCRSPSPPNIIQDPLTLQQLKEQKDLNGKLFVTIQQQVLEINQKGQLTDSLAKALKVKPKFIQGATIIKTVIDTQFKDTGSVKIILIGGDTAHIVQHVDKWIDIKAYAFTNPKNWHLDHIDFKLEDSLYFIQVHKQPLFGPGTDEIIVRSANPNNHIVAGASYKVKEKLPWLVFGVGGGYQFLPSDKWSLGFYVIYPVFSLKK